MKNYDVIIIGGGPAGLTAGVYTKRAKLNALLLEKTAIGGQMLLADVIENYPGFLEIKGFELAQKMEEQARKFGLEIKFNEVKQVKSEEKKVFTEEEVLTAKALIIASGAEPAKLNVKGEEKLIGKGVSYCATCDGAFFTGKEVAVVGGGDTALIEALYLSKIARKVYLIHRRDKFRGEKINQEKVLSNPKITVLWDTIVQEIIGKNKVEAILIKNVKTGKEETKLIDGIFIAIGRKPNTSFINVEKDDLGYIKVNEEMETNVKGVFAAGDCTSRKWRQITTAIGEGAKAAISAENYIEKL
ncbi:MAG: thioredoxin-disulfide reductase [Candidatus Bathyarchaeia archaeon]|nr:thioredoxin-disulfide reductase [Candidatus Bathyarchaeota archaeon]